MSIVSDDLLRDIKAALAAGGSAAGGWGFDVVVTPGVTNGPYSANDIMGGPMTFSNVARAIDEAFIITEIQVALKAAVTPSLIAVMWTADPTTVTDFEDNDAYSVPAADIFKVRRSLPFLSLGGYWTDHGTPNTCVLPLPVPLVMKPYVGTRDTKMTLIDATGVTLTSISDLQVRLVGIGV